VTGAHAQTVRWSKGTEKPKHSVYPGAVDCHHHIYDSRFPIHPSATLKSADALVSDYRKLQERIGTSRNVVIQPSTYGTDNRCLLDALKQFGNSARGVAVVNTSVSEAELKAMHQAGVRGLRFNLQFPVGITADMIRPLAERVAPLGWHLQFNMTADQLIKEKGCLAGLPCPVVLDHMGHVPPLSGSNDPAFTVVMDMLEKGNTWVKLSGAYLESKVGAPSYSDVATIAQAYEKAAPNRLVWGSDWPHPTEKPEHKPDDAQLIDLLAEWFPEASRHRILVANPSALYGFKSI
jgi:predicted TIM-barrel fold metal-dependent hydrolase